MENVDLLRYWYLFPSGVLIATFYTSTGISGANFWAPVYLLWIGVDPRLGFWLSLVSMLFGSLGGLIAHLRAGTISYRLGSHFLLRSIPWAVVGAMSVPHVSPRLLLSVFGGFVIGYGAYFLWRTLRGEAQFSHSRAPALWVAGVGGFLTGLISVGLGKLLLPQCLKDSAIRHHAEAAGTTLLVVFLTSLVATLARLDSQLLSTLRSSQSQLAGILLYVIPGVLCGGQVGPRLAACISLRTMRLYVALLLQAVGCLMLIRAWQG